LEAKYGRKSKRLAIYCCSNEVAQGK